MKSSPVCTFLERRKLITARNVRYTMTAERNMRALYTGIRKE
jgi:hypothetical protein